MRTNFSRSNFARLASLLLFVTYAPWATAQVPVTDASAESSLTQIMQDSNNMYNTLQKIQQQNANNTTDLDSLLAIEKARAAMWYAMNNLQAFKDRGQLIESQEQQMTGGSGSGTGAASSLTSGTSSGVSFGPYSVSSTGAVTGTGAGYIGNIISPMFGVPASFLTQAPTSLTALTGSLGTQVMNYATSLTSNMSSTGSSISTALNKLGISVTMNTPLDRPWRSRYIPVGYAFQNSAAMFGQWMMLDVQTTTTTSSSSAQVSSAMSGGAQLLADGITVRPPSEYGGSSNGLVDGLYQQVVSSGTPAQQVLFYGSPYYTNGSTTYSPLLGQTNLQSQGVNIGVNLSDVFTNGLYSALQSSSNPSAAAAYSNVSSVASIMASQIGSVGAGGKLQWTGTTTTTSSSTPTLTVTPSMGLFSTTVSSANSKVHRHYAAEDAPPHLMNCYYSFGPGGSIVYVQSTTTSGNAVMATTLTGSQMSSFQSGMSAAQSRMSAIETQIQSDQQYITLLSALATKNQALCDGIRNTLLPMMTQTTSNSIPQITQILVDLENFHHSLSKEQQDMTGSIETLNQRLYLTAQEMDQVYQTAQEQLNKGQQLRQHIAMDQAVRSAAAASSSSGTSTSTTTSSTTSL